MGKTWQKITTGLPAGVYVHAVKEDPQRKGLLFAGTERGAFVSFDDGDHWQPLRLNLPVTSVRDFQVYGNDLIVATHGRGFWVMDDISPLRQLNDTVLAGDAYLFKPADAINVIQGGGNGTPFQRDEARTDNPPDGVIIYYSLKSGAAGAVTIEILDDKGTTLETFSNVPQAQGQGAGRGTGVPGGPGGGAGGGIPNTSALWRVPPEPFSAAAGLHRAVWRAVVRPQRGGPGGGGGIFGGPVTPLTGTFTAKLTVNGKSQTQTFVVKPDPRNSEG
jgi:hypothetical protein